MTSADAGLLRSVFVYGTLMPGEQNARVAEAAGAPERAERAALSGFILYDLQPEQYPALVSGPDSRHAQPEQLRPVRGWRLTYSAEVWPTALVHLDELEGIHLTPPLYTRTRAQVQTAEGPKPAWVYLYARSGRLRETGCTLVPSGDWTHRPQASSNI